MKNHGKSAGDVSLGGWWPLGKPDGGGGGKEVGFGLVEAVQRTIWN